MPTSGLIKVPCVIFVMTVRNPSRPKPYISCTIASGMLPCVSFPGAAEWPGGRRLRLLIHLPMRETETSWTWRKRWNKTWKPTRGFFTSWGLGVVIAILVVYHLITIGIYSIESQCQSIFWCWHLNVKGANCSSRDTTWSASYDFEWIPSRGWSWDKRWEIFDFPIRTLVRHVSFH